MLSLSLSLSMMAIASMIAVGGLGQRVLRGIGRLDMGLATVGGVSIQLMLANGDASVLASPNQPVPARTSRVDGRWPAQRILELWPAQ